MKKCISYFLLSRQVFVLVITSALLLPLITGCGSAKWFQPPVEEKPEWKFEEAGNCTYETVSETKDNPQEEENLKGKISHPEDTVVWDKSKIQLTRREFRGVWLTTLNNLDWPDKASYGQPALQKKALDEYLDLFQSLYINVVFLQIRAAADAFYDSAYEPWSWVFTGKRGQTAGWDPIRYVVEEAHARGMQLHVWMNPYRIQTKKPFDKDLQGIPVGLVKDYAGIRMYNPGLPAVRDRIVAIVEEVLEKYPEVDGIHFDDYFYPAPSQCGGKLQDAKEYSKYNPKGLSLEDWRYDNVNQMVQMVQKAVHTKNPNLIFSISPGANTKNNEEIYADVPLWCERGWVDAIIPQLYWDRAFFDARLEEFCGYAKSVPLIVGYATYKFSENPSPYKGSSTFDDVEVFREEYDLAAQKEQVVGGSHYRAFSLKANRIGIRDKVREVYHSYRLAPYLGPDDHPLPETPSEIEVNGNGLMTWTGDAVRFAIYKDANQGEERGKKAYLIGVTSGHSYQLPEAGTYYITALDRYNAESMVSDMVTCLVPES